MEFKQETESFYYIKSAIKKINRYWYVFALTISACLFLAFLLNWYLQPLYEVSSVILIEENQNNKPAPSEEFMKSFSIFTPVSNIQQEVLKMKSTELVSKALKKINAEITYYVTNSIKTKEVYNDFPFQIEFERNHFQPMEVRFQIIPKGEKLFQIIGEKEEQVQLYNFEKKITRYIDSFSINKTVSYGDSIKTDFISIRILPRKDQPSRPGSKFSFALNDLNNLTYIYQKALVIEQVAKDIEAAKITIKSKSPQQGIDFVNALTEAYLKRSIDRKNMVAENTIQYLNEQLNIVEDSLNLTEGNLQAFRSSNQVMNIDSKADMTFRDANELENQKADLQARIKYYNYISTNLEKEGGSNILVPSSMGVNDNVLTGLIDEYIKLNTERNTLIQNKQSQSPYFNSLTIKINNQKNTLSENVKYLINTNNMLLASIEDRLRKENAKISTLPGTERKLVGIERKYKVNDDNYNFILRKKAEAQVAKASNILDNDIIEPAKLTKQTPVSPNKTLNLGIAFFIGLILPFAGFGAKNFMNNTIREEYQMKSITQLPSIGRIYHHRKKKQQSSILIDVPRSAIAESFRSVRTNIEYFLQGKRKQVILVTSTMTGEGKSFCSMNLAVSMALLNRKTVLVDFDIRKPNLYHALKVENTLGMSSFLAGNVQLEDVVVPTAIPNLDFITAGPIPSNPAELIGSERTENLLKELRDTYDYVIIDTPPLGLVTEAFLLMKYADLKLFVARERHTSKKQLSILLNELESKKVSDIFWLYNDVDVKDTEYGKKNAYYTNN